MDQKITIGGTEYNIRMANGVFKHIKHYTGEDAFVFMQKLQEDISFSVFVLLASAMKVYVTKHGGEPVDDQKLKDFAETDTSVKDLHVLGNLYNEYVLAGEAPAQEKENPSPGPNVKNSGTAS